MSFELKTVTSLSGTFTIDKQPDNILMDPNTLEDILKMILETTTPKTIKVLNPKTIDPPKNFPVKKKNLPYW